jgi:hypothetical protein
VGAKATVRVTEEVAKLAAATKTEELYHHVNIDGVSGNNERCRSSKQLSMTSMRGKNRPDDRDHPRESGARRAPSRTARRLRSRKRLFWD